jgi:23S rRNA-/tRNA-specific pseudouridylate synthase
VIQTNTKGKWCGKSVLQVVRQEFADVSKELEVILGHNLLRVNGKIVTKEDDVKMKNMDIIDRIVHWHEPPVLVPERIPVEIASIPGAVIEEYNLNETEATLLICDKPSSVPVHPTGPYFSNSLTVMVEAQCGLEPKSLFPCHRLDRVTSGLTICTSHVEVSRMVQSKMDKGSVRKLYIAKVQGKFPSKQASFGEVQLERNTLINFRYLEDVDAIEIDAPIHAADPTAGIRVIANGGKPSTSRFRRVSYNADEDTSLIVCHPVTGRGHQLRVHLQALGYPITGDILYGGKLLSGTGVKDAAVDVMMQNFSEGENGSDLVSVSDVDAAKSACRCCTGGKEGIEASFTQAQLLGGGHAISLHALRYEIDFYSKKDATKLIGTLSMQVGIPAWADLVQEELLHWLV